jgi:hypothetical protein
MSSWLGNLWANSSMKLTIATEHYSFNLSIIATQAWRMHITKNLDEEHWLNGTISLGSKNNIFNVVVASIHQIVSIPSLLQLIRFTKPLNYSLVYFFSRSQYNVCKFTQHNVFTTHTKSHTNISWLWTNLIRSWTTSNMGIMLMKPRTTSASHKISKMG